MKRKNLESLGEKLATMCRAGKSLDAIKELYDDDIVSIESVAHEQMPRELRGKTAVIGKGQWWEENHHVHTAEIKGPFPHGADKFALVFNFDVTFKPTSTRNQLEEVALYHVAAGKIVREEFFYTAP